MIKDMAAKNAFTDLDGRTLEGGGQLLRNALCISALTGKALRVHDIRGNRSGRGGLKAQHLACVKWLANACKARVEGAEKGSKTLHFAPTLAANSTCAELSPAFKKVTSNGETFYETRLDIGTAGATGLALQAILPFILFSSFPSAHPVKLTLTGGTNVSGSPSYEYISEVLLPTLHALGLPDIKAQINRRGWSHGGASIGSISMLIPHRSNILLASFRLRSNGNQAILTTPSLIEAVFLAPALSHRHMTDVLAPAIQTHFGARFSVSRGNLTIRCEDSAHDKRMYLILLATIVGSSRTFKLARDWLYDRKIQSHERAATDMAKAVSDAISVEVKSGACVDEHMRDQLVIFQALADGRSEVYPGADDHGDLREPTLHTRTAEHIAKLLLGVRFDANNSCEGIGYGDGSRSCKRTSEQSGTDGESNEAEVALGNLELD